MAVMSSTTIASPQTLAFRVQSLNFSPRVPLPSISNSCSHQMQRCVPVRLQALVSEFRSIKEPIDRVKKLLEYATTLPGGSQSIRSPENRVGGCAAQVWVEVEMDEFWRMRFGADSDSEIVKGFASCLVSLLQGASPQQVLMVKAEDLEDMNIGLPVRSRVNSWHNLLRNMQERTRSLMEERGGIPPFQPISIQAIDIESDDGTDLVFLRQTSHSNSKLIGARDRTL